MELQGAHELRNVLHAVGRSYADRIGGHDVSASMEISGTPGSIGNGAKEDGRTIQYREVDAAARRENGTRGGGKPLLSRHGARPTLRSRSACPPRAAGHLRVQGIFPSVDCTSGAPGATSEA
jgi:hypothetical protein